MTNPQSGPRSKVSDPFLLLDENRSASWLLTEFGTRLHKCSQLLYVYGPAGSGKSHLVSDTVARLRQTHSGLQVMLTSGSEIAGRAHQDDESSDLLSLREKCTQADVFVCEDIQGISSSEPAQEFLCGLLDEFKRVRGSVILTGRALPRQLNCLSRRLASRCIVGEHVALQPPGHDSRAMLLAHFAQLKQFPLAPQICALLARHLEQSPRELAASITKLDAMSRLYGVQTIDEEFAWRFLEDEVLEQHVSIAEIARAVARHFGFRASELRSQKRHQGVVVARQCAMFLTRELTNTPLQVIAGYFGRRTHTTVSHACARIRELMSTQPAMRQELIQIRESLRVSVG